MANDRSRTRQSPHTSHLAHDDTDAATPLSMTQRLDRCLSEIADRTAFFTATAEANEDEGKLQTAVVETLIDIGAIHALVPREFGGLELDAVAGLRIVEALSEADPAIGWVAMATGFCSGAASAYVDDDAAAIMFARGKSGIVAGAGAPTGIAKPVPGGFEVTGQWRYGSGILHAEWAHCGVMVQGSGAPESRIVYVPMNEVERLGNWDVIGLRATGSIDYSVTNVFVPENFTVRSAAPTHRRGDVLFRDSFTFGTLIGHTGWAMGAARRLLKELAEFARAGSLRQGALAADGAFHADFARHEARVRAARSWIYDIWKRGQTCLNEGARLSTDELTQIRLALVFATEAAADAAYFAFRAAGGETLRQGVMQRLCRDILAGSQHITSSAAVLQSCGRVIAGLAPGEAWVVNTLMKPRPQTV